MIDSSHGAPSTIRCIKTRRRSCSSTAASRTSQGAPSTIRCIKTCIAISFFLPVLRRQGAPSTIRCIKTSPVALLTHAWTGVREHPAPSGALRLPVRASVRTDWRARQGAPSTIRCIKTTNAPTPAESNPTSEVREHPAPSGALRPAVVHGLVVHLFHGVREHPAPPGALRRTAGAPACAPCPAWSGSTQHHQVH